MKFLLQEQTPSLRVAVAIVVSNLFRIFFFWEVDDEFLSDFLRYPLGYVRRSGFPARLFNVCRVYSSGNQIGVVPNLARGKLRCSLEPILQMNVPSRIPPKPCKRCFVPVVWITPCVH